MHSCYTARTTSANDFTLFFLLSNARSSRSASPRSLIHWHVSSAQMVRDSHGTRPFNDKSSDHHLATRGVRVSARTHGAGQAERRGKLRKMQAFSAIDHGRRKARDDKQSAEGCRS